MQKSMISLLGFSLLVCNLSCSTTKMAKNPSVQVGSSPLKVIDAHIHTAFNGKLNPDSKIKYVKENLIQELDSAGIVGAVSMVSLKGVGIDSTLQARNIKFCASVNATPNYKEIERRLESKQVHCLKIYLGYVHKFAHDVIYRPAYQLAKKYKVPVVFHTGDIYDVDGKLKYSDPMTIDEVAVEHRDVTMVIAHLGNPWITTAAEVAYKNPNVYLEASAILIGDLSRFTPEQIDEQMVKPIRWVFQYLENPNKLMFGTDWPLTSIGPYLEAFKKAIPPEHWQAVFHDNAARVFGF